MDKNYDAKSIENILKMLKGFVYNIEHKDFFVKVDITTTEGLCRRIKISNNSDDKFEVNQYEYIQDLNLFVNKGTKEYENGICGDDLNFDKAKQMIDVQVAQFYLLAKNQKINKELNNIKRGLSI